MIGTPSPRDTLHQLRNHLGIVLSFSELLAESLEADDPRREDMAAIHGAARDALQLLPQLEPADSERS